MNQVFRDYEDASYASLKARITSLKSSVPGAVFDALLSKIYKRSL
jgi:hypothetical protein